MRSDTSLIQTIGRAARNACGEVIMYADRITDSMQRAIDETNRRRGIQDKYNKYNSTGIDTCSNFLNLEKLKIVTKYLDSKKIEYHIYEPYDFLEKKIIYFGEYLDYVTIYKATIPDKINHSNILGTLFSLGISDDIIGDIFVEDGYFYYTNLTRMNQFIEDNLTRISNYPVKLKRVDEIILNKDHFKELNVLVSSKRLDNVVSKIINKSRRQIDEMIANKEILLNYEEIKNGNKILNDNDILSIRRHGKYKIVCEDGITKRNNIVLKLVKYV